MSECKEIWLINQYAMPPQYESRLRTIKFAHYLTQIGYNVTIFASSVMHNMDIDLIKDNRSYIEQTYGDLHFVHIKGRKYHKNGLSRIIGLFQFPLRLLQITKKFKQPDVILHTATVPFGNIIARIAKRYHAMYIVEVLDLWPRTFVELGLISKNNPFVKLLYWLEYKQYQKADKLIFSMEGGVDYIRDKGWDTSHKGMINTDNIHYINNGVDIEDFDTFRTTHILYDEDLINDKIIRIIYLGSIRLANSIDNLIDAAKLLKNRTNVKFLIYGNGDDRERLEARVKNESIDNIIFKQKWVAPQYVPYILSCSYINVLNYMPGNIGYYGGSQSKLFQYMASAKPICCNIQMMYCPITKYNLGIAKNFASAAEYAGALCQLIDLPPKQYKEMCEQARSAAQEFDYKVLTARLSLLF